MNRNTAVYAIAFFLTLGAAGAVLASQDKPEKQEEKARAEKSERQKQEKPANQEKQQPARTPQEQKPHDNAVKQEQQRQRATDSAKQQEQEQRKQQDASNKHEQQIAIGEQDQQRRQQQRQDSSVNRQQQARDQHPQRDDSAERQRNPAQANQRQAAFQEERAHSWQSEHRNWQQRGGYNGYRVPDDRFRQYYGQDHDFRIESLPVIFVGGRQRFQYGGYWFGLIDPWPEYWSDDWYDRDDVYVNFEGDGYYLYNRRYPSDRIAISFYLN